ncbi:hypothetical protein BJY01DRAFT_250672 [Aspergillus pseudoustus]|uniref:Uncharacterized protein n=1 Tax=Aspergillus pseudoustus TaxID=1810923 RepID=A0ABR4JG92_9EURO
MHTTPQGNYRQAVIFCFCLPARSTLLWGRSWRRDWPVLCPQCLDLRVVALYELCSLSPRRNEAIEHLSDDRTANAKNSSLNLILERKISAEMLYRTFWTFCVTLAASK